MTDNNANWKKARIKDVSTPYTGNSIKDEHKDLYIDNINAIPYISTKDINDKFQTIDFDNGLFIKNSDKSFRRAPKNSTLLCIEGGNAGKKIAFNDRTVCFVNKLCCFHSKTENNKFLYYFLMSPSFTEEFKSRITGLIGGVSVSALRNIHIRLPAPDEQEKIADFLDEKCAEIDKLSEDIQKQIDILNNYKKSVITRAVTKGLDPNVEMKDSGDERLDMIPANWDAKKLKFVTREIYENGLMVPENDKYIGMENVLSYSNDFHETNTEYEISFQKKCKKGVVLFGKLRPYLAKVIICPFTGFATGEFMQLSNFDGDSRYLRYSLLNRTFIEFVNMSTYGAKMPRANSEYINNLKICIPPKDEQCKIADFLDNVCQKINESIRLQQKQLSHLDTYKRSIIYEYVTGKKRVKGTL